MSDRDMRLDERCVYHSDIDLVLTELLYRRVVFRDDRFIFTFEPTFKTKGGSIDHYKMTMKTEEETLMRRKWGPYIRFRHTPGHWNETAISVQR